MKPKLILATVLIFIGCVIFVGVMSMLNWDFSKISTEKFETNEFKTDEKIKNISVKSNTADIEFKVNDDKNISVVCYENQKQKHLVEVKNDTLIIKINDKRKWYEYIGISFGNPKVSISLPKGEYGNLVVDSDTSDVYVPEQLKFENVDVLVSTGNVSYNASVLKELNISTTTGNVKAENVSANKINFSVSTGRIIASSVVCEGDISVEVSTGKSSLTDIKCKNIYSKGNTGNITLNNVIASESFKINRSTGNVLLDKCDSKELQIITDTGDVKGTLLTDKIFITKTDTGSVRVPKTTTGGICEITTDTGNINISIE